LAQLLNISLIPGTWKNRGKAEVIAHFSQPTGSNFSNIFSIIYH